ncbi:CitMHS family transporter [Pseudomonas uvaldensis]|uniref:CitMHS family transporter n=1 Tax=Pseudomonas uvaldensis TaxID=2878385 RepID=UPI0022B7FC1C|nr:citrate:proton symporter [Pseudomonas uvaldensis]MCE0463291.1 citrate:proton symporter [Pseudomonas uvaldensis]
MAWLGFAMVVTFMALIISKRLSAVTALVLIPVAFGLASGAGPELGAMVMDGVKQVAPTALMLMFAILYFAIMFDAGLFEPAVRRILRHVGNDPLRVVLGTALLAAVISFDGDGATTVLIVTTAFLPLYLRLGMNPLILALMLLLTNTVVNLIPWGGPVARAASALHVDVGEMFLGLVPAMLVGLAYAFLVAFWIGHKERRRLGWTPAQKEAGPALDQVPLPEVRAETQRPRLFWINLALTAGLMYAMGTGLAPLPLVMMVGFCLALLINYPRLAEQKARIAAHAESVLTVIALIFASGVFTGILSGTGMVDGMSEKIVQMIPEGGGQYFSILTALLALPLNFLLSNDAFFFGILPVLGAAGAEYGIDPMHIARASVLGQPVHALSPLVAAVYLISGIIKRDMGDMQRYCLLWAIGSSLVLIVTTIITRAII